MSAFMRQGLDTTEAVLGIFDPVPVVLYDHDVATRFNYRYIVRVARYNAGWETIATLKRIPNTEGCGVYDLSQLLRGSLEVTDPSNDANDTATNPCSFANNAEVFRIRIGSEYATTEGGTISEDMTDFYYISAIAGRFLTEFDEWGGGQISSNYVLKVSGSNKKLLTERSVGWFQFGAGRYEGYVVRIPRRDIKFSFTFLSTDITPPWDTERAKLYVAIADENGLIASDTLLLPVFQAIDNTTFYTMDLGSGGVTRECHIGYADIQTYSWASNINNNSTWTTLYAELRRNTDNKAISKPVMLKLDPCGQDGVQFKFMNRLGGYDYVFCYGHTQMSIDYTRETYATGTGNWHTADGITELMQVQDPNKRQTKSNVTQEKRKYTAHTGIIPANENDLIMALLGSKRVYATRFVAPLTAPEVDYYPVVITNSNVRAMYQQTDKVLEYTIEFEYANKPRPMV